MNIYEALKSKNITHANREYFRYKHNLYFDQTKDPPSPERFLKNVNRKTFNGFKKWERTPQYKALLAIYLDSLMANDLEEIYQVVREKARDGDEKSIKLYLSLNKDLQQQKKIAEKMLGHEDYEEDDDLELD